MVKKTKGIFPTKEETERKKVDWYSKVYIILMNMVEKRIFGYPRRRTYSTMLDQILGSGRGREETNSIRKVIDGPNTPVLYRKDGLKVIMITCWLNPYKGKTETWLKYGSEKGFDENNDLRDVEITKRDWLKFLKEMDQNRYYKERVPQSTIDLIKKGVFKQPIDIGKLRIACKIREKMIKRIKEEICRG